MEWVYKLNEMDFKGQLLAERLYQIIIAVVSVVGFIHGYVEQSFKVTFTYWLIASLVAALLTVPGWPVLYHRHPVKWLDKLPAASAATSNSASSSGPGVPTPAQPAANKQATKKQQ